MGKKNNFFNFSETTEYNGGKMPPHKKVAFVLSPLIGLGTLLFAIFNRPMYNATPVLLGFGLAIVLYIWAIFEGDLIPKK